MTMMMMLALSEPSVWGHCYRHLSFSVVRASHEVCKAGIDGLARAHTRQETETQVH